MREVVRERELYEDGRKDIMSSSSPLVTINNQ